MSFKKESIWGDAWVGSTKAWFNLYFYPQYGGVYSQESGYIYSSFTKTGKLSWGPFQGGDGAIYGQIDGSGSSYPIGKVDNASRVIKYIGILGYRYNSYNLVDMRIHDINVVCDLNEQDPNAPTLPPPIHDPPAGESQPVIESDGTSDGNIEAKSADTPEGFENDLEQAANSVRTYWTGPWPECHIEVDNAPTSDVKVTVKTKIDLIGNLAYEDTNFELANLDDMTQVDVGDFKALTEEVESNDYFSWLVFIFGTTLSGMIWLAELLAGGLGAVTTQYLVLYCIVIIALHAVFLYTVINFLRSLYLSEIEVQQLFVAIVFNSILVSAAALYTLHGMKEGILGALGYFSSRYKASKPGQPGAIGRGNVVVFLMNLILIAMTIVAFVGLTQGTW
ncbi:MAG: hypothetical protein P1Q69_12300 [Candidatus Thorarchaeota archaeon]|nr:hypothetical protein [Candidatus Thorarchaeota archaeon]